MNQWLEAFVLGNAAILTNVCILPLYPGLIAYMAAGPEGGQSRSARWLGAAVLAGILTLMVAVGALLYFLSASFGAILSWLLPLIYTVVIVLGILMLIGRNPFKAMTQSQAPLLKNRLAGAYLYGILLGPMTLPCAGPIIVSAFIIGAGTFNGLADALVYFLFFGLGFGWPLVLLPFLAMPFQRRFTGWMTQHAVRFAQVSGVLLIAIGLFGFYAEVLPNL
jgi:cytochrome c-type biogenesis protein